jgi:hypothetical protein
MSSTIFYKYRADERQSPLPLVSIFIIATKLLGEGSREKKTRKGGRYIVSVSTVLKCKEGRKVKEKFHGICGKTLKESAVDQMLVKGLRGIQV